MDPDKQKSQPLNIQQVIRMHRERVVEFGREIAELEAKESQQAATSPEIAPETAIVQEDTPPPVVPLPVNADAEHSKAEAIRAENNGRQSALPTVSKLNLDEQALQLLRFGSAKTSPEGELVGPTKHPEKTNNGEGVSDIGQEKWRADLAKIDKACECLGIWQALFILSERHPQEWRRHPELADAEPSARNRRWRLGKNMGTVVDLFKYAFDDPDSVTAANRIIKFVDSCPADDLIILHPDAGESTQDRASGKTGSRVDGTTQLAVLPDIEDAADLLSKDCPQPLELVEGILHQGSKLILSAGSKDFKTWSLLDLGLSVAYGREWLGFSTHQGEVLYINLEIQEAFFRGRIRTVADAKSITIAKGHFSVMNLCGYAADLSKLLPQLLATISTRKYALVILDPIYKVLGGRDENNAGQIAEMLNDLGRLAMETGAAVVFAAHYSKGNQASKQSIDRMSGSGVFARDPDTILALTQHEEENSYTVEATLRNHPPIKPFVVRWKFPLMERDSDLDPKKLKQVAGRPKAHTANDLLKVLGEGEMSFSAWKAAALKVGISETTFKALRRDLVTAGRVWQCEEKGTYHRAETVEKTV